MFYCCAKLHLLLPCHWQIKFILLLVTFDATCVGLSEIELIIAKTSKTCHLDAMPSEHIKDNMLSLASVVTDITNASLSEGVMPNQLKHALVHPRLKKPSLGRNALNNYRPVSHLQQLSKIIEKVIADRLNTHLCNESLKPGVHTRDCACLRPDWTVASQSGRDSSAFIAPTEPRTLSRPDPDLAALSRQLMYMHHGAI